MTCMQSRFYPLTPCNATSTLEVSVPFNNNQAERDLRSAKVKQPVSECFLTRSGARVYARFQWAISNFPQTGSECVCYPMRFVFTQ
jgi:hypothetical protein